MQAYMEGKKANSEDMCRIYERRIAHIYYKIDYKFLEGSQKSGAAQVSLPLSLTDQPVGPRKRLLIRRWPVRRWRSWSACAPTFTIRT